jgi:DNA-directed RNA polymerase beta subunit
MLDIKKVERNAKEFENSHKFLAEELLTPFANHCDMVRQSMFNNHLTQSKVLIKSEYPRVFTNFENQVGKYSTAYKIADDNLKILKVFEKNKLNKTFIVMDSNNELNILFSKPCERLTERFGYKLYNDGLENKKENDIIKKGDIIYRSSAYDKDMNFGYGVNLNACFLAYDNMTYEDAIVIAESAAKKFDSYSVDEITITLNTNDLLINLKGNSDIYKSFPDIGEKCDSILCARRRINYNNILFDLNTENITKLNEEDCKFYVNNESIIYDIDVYSNQTIEDLERFHYNSQIVKYLKQNIKYYTSIKKFLDKYIDDENYTFSNDLKYYYKRYSQLIDSRRQFRFEKNNFDNLVIKIKTYNIKKLTIGSKITNRYGGKGVIGCMKKSYQPELNKKYSNKKIIIVPDEEMPVNQYGERADVCLNPMGVSNRENIGQLFEQELNFIGNEVLRASRKKELDSIDKKFEYVMDFYKILNKKQYDFLINRYQTEEEKKEFLLYSYENGLFIHEAPFFGNNTVDDMNKLYERFGYHPYTCYVKGKKIEKPLIMGQIYYMILRHDPSGKFSARSNSELNLNNLPSKSSSYKNHNSLFSKTPVRLGEQEVVSLLLTKDMEIVSRYLAQQSSNPEEREHFNTDLLTTNDVFNIERIERINKKSVTSKIVKTYFTVIGLENELTDEPEEE